MAHTTVTVGPACDDRDERTPTAKTDSALSPLPPIRVGRYRHYKGKDYEVLALAYHSETLEPMVVYRALYGKGDTWVRPAAMWSEIVTHDGVSEPRFRFIEGEI